MRHVVCFHLPVLETSSPNRPAFECESPAFCRPCAAAKSVQFHRRPTVCSANGSSCRLTCLRFRLWSSCHLLSRATYFSKYFIRHGYFFLTILHYDIRLCTHYTSGKRGITRVMFDTDGASSRFPDQRRGMENNERKPTMR